MSDLISRQAAIDALDGEIEITGRTNAEAVKGYVRLVKDRLERLPSAQPQRKTGRWIIKDNPGTGWYRVTCSECGEDVTSTAPCIGFYPNAKVTWDYCPNCGAKMVEYEDYESESGEGELK